MVVRVLLVEDESLIRMVTAEFLEEAGYAVSEAWDGDEAVRLLDGSGRFDVLVTDVQMPGERDGLGVAEHARRRFADMPVLVVSGYAPQLMARLRELQPAALFLAKPYTLQEIVAALTRLTVVP